MAPANRYWGGEDYGLNGLRPRLAGSPVGRRLHGSEEVPQVWICKFRLFFHRHRAAAFPAVRRSMVPEWRVVAPPLRI